MGHAEKAGANFFEKKKNQLISRKCYFENIKVTSIILFKTFELLRRAFLEKE